MLASGERPRERAKVQAVRGNINEQSARMGAAAAALILFAFVWPIMFLEAPPAAGWIIARCPACRRPPQQRFLLSKGSSNMA